MVRRKRRNFVYDVWRADLPAPAIKFGMSGLAPAEPGADLSGAIEPLDRAAKLGDRAAELIRAAIVTGRLPAGAKVTVAGVARLLGVSNTPIREALIRLAEAGLVRIEGASVRITEASTGSVEMAFELREQIEALTSRLAAQRRTDDEAAELKRVAQASLKAADRADQPAFRNADANFHLMVAAMARNEYLEHYARNAYDLASTLRNVRKLSQQFRARAAHMHAEIAEAIDAHDADRAEFIARRHVAAVLVQITE